MSRYPFYHTIKDERLGINLASYIECEVEISVSLEFGEPVVEVGCVFIDGANLYNGGPIAQLMAAEIADAAEDDAELISRALEDSDIAFVGLGANDPGSHFTRAH